MSKSTTPRKFTPEFKLTAVLESYATGNIAGTAARNNIHLSQLNQWRKQLLTMGVEAFKSKRSHDKTDYEHKIDQMERTIGRLALENELLKKTAQLLG